MQDGGQQAIHAAQKLELRERSRQRAGELHRGLRRALPGDSQVIQAKANDEKPYMVHVKNFVEMQKFVKTSVWLRV